MRKKKWLALLFLLSQTLIFSVNASGGQRMLTDEEEEYAYIGRHAGEILAGGSRKADGGETENGAPENTPASIWRRYACSELFEAGTTDAREMEIGGRKEEPRGSAAEGRNTFPVYEFEKVAEASRRRDRSPPSLLGGRRPVPACYASVGEYEAGPRPGGSACGYLWRRKVSHPPCADRDPAGRKETRTGKRKNQNFVRKCAANCSWAWDRASSGAATPL